MIDAVAISIASSAAVGVDALFFVDAFALGLREEEEAAVADEELSNVVVVLLALKDGSTNTLGSTGGTRIY
jgi:hypothetical protein